MDFSIVPARFYGRSLKGVYDEIEKNLEKNKKYRAVDPYYKDKPRSLLQPCFYKQEFWKQNEALQDAADHSHDDDILCCFVFQDQNEKRHFIVMYPEDFWEESEHLPLERRVFYEVGLKIFIIFFYMYHFVEHISYFIFFN